MTRAPAAINMTKSRTLASAIANFMGHASIRAMLCATLAIAGPNVSAKDYFLKFETPGGSHASGSFAANAGAVMNVSIVDVLPDPLDAPLHFPGSGLGAESAVKVAGGADGRPSTDHLRFYYAGVPRSLTIVDRRNMTRAIITAGEPAQQFQGAPAFLLKDRLIVATGLSQDWINTAFSVVIVAGTPLETVPVNNSAFGDVSATNTTADSTQCNQGWARSPAHPNEIQLWQSVSRNSSAPYYCYDRLVFAGPVNYVVLEE